MKETKSKTKEKDYRGLKIASLSLVAISIVVYIAVGAVNSYLYTPDFKDIYTLMLVGSGIFTLACFVVCVNAVVKIKRRRYLYAICSLATFYMMASELVSAFLFNLFVK